MTEKEVLTAICKRLSYADVTPEPQSNGHILIYGEFATGVVEFEFDAEGKVVDVSCDTYC